MNRWMILPAMALVAATSGASFQSQSVTRADRDLADALKGLTPGEPVTCVSATNVSGPQLIDHKTLLYREGRTVWRNDLPSECRGMESGNTLIVEVNGGQICQNDSFRVIEPGMSIPGPHCRFGKFTPYRK
ncbi:hypothetical protein OF829_15155 [Sphingomonas sp. LB-2]|uniref:hypothetical protein n=1 Tax=Sphingomonas caeni TaxID=2984949 RepID=UPI002230B62C|nr:hypothetical protein [Sphingomonas caeni]MCW3848572.1 hypothetical protein [Sphingomonas caeni]